MVFGLCLRSLLEHQKNPKKPLQKHFQNSLLTRYLRDYLEGKKRMSLILTVKPGEEDYLDTASLLRQASPYMKIKFNNVEEQSNSVLQKRQIQSLFGNEEPRRKKCCDIDTRRIEEGKNFGVKEVTDSPKIIKLDSVEIAPVKSDIDDFATRERNSKIMQNFAKALWNVLKDYKRKLMEAEKTIENLRSEKSKYLELEKKLQDFKSCCTCSQENSANTTFLKVENGCDVPVHLKGNECAYVHEIKMLKESKCYNSPTKCNLDQDLLTQMNGSIHVVNPEASDCKSTCSKYVSSLGWDKDLFSQVHRPSRNQQRVCLQDVSSNSPDLEPFEFTSTPGGNQDVTSQMDGNVSSPALEESKCSSTPRCDQEILTLTDVNVSALNLKESECSSTPRHDQDISSLTDVSIHSSELEASKCNSMPRQDQTDADVSSANLNEFECSSTPTREKDISSLTDVNIHSSELKACKCKSTPRKDQDISMQMDVNVPSPNLKESKSSTTPRCDKDIRTLTDVSVHSSALKASKCNSRPRHDQDFLSELDKKPLDPPQSQCNLDVPDCEAISNTSHKSSNLKKPKRRLLPASSVLLRDITALGIENEPDKPKGNRGGKKLAADERTQGSNSLLRLLQTNLRL